MNTGMPYIMQHCTVIFRHMRLETEKERGEKNSYTIAIASETYDPAKQDRGTAHPVTVKHHSPQSDLIIIQQSAKHSGSSIACSWIPCEGQPAVLWNQLLLPV